MDEEIATIVSEHGWFFANVSDAAIPFCYTIGLMTTHQHPELIAFSLAPQGAYSLFTAMVNAIEQGTRFEEKGIKELQVGVDTHRIKIRSVHPSQHPLYLGFAMGHLTRQGRIGELQAVQVCWPDELGDFPFDLNCNPRLNELQPRLDIPLSAQESAEFYRRYGS